MTCCIFSKETAVQDTKKISTVGKKMAEKMSDQKAGETHSLYCSNVYTPLYHALYQKHVLLHEGFVPHEPELVKIHCLWPEEPAVFTAWQLLGKFYFNRSKWITYCLSLLCQDPYFSLKNRCLNSFAFFSRIEASMRQAQIQGVELLFALLPMHDLHLPSTYLLCLKSAANYASSVG